VCHRRCPRSLAGVMSPKRLTDKERLLREVPEKAFMEQIRQEARMAGWLTYHTHNSQRSEPGWPDLALIKERRLVFIETKKQTGKVTAEQQRWIDELNTVDGAVEAYVFRPSDWEQIHEVLL
jgi:hypothetical protein